MNPSEMMFSARQSLLCAHKITPFIACLLTGHSPFKAYLTAWCSYPHPYRYLHPYIWMSSGPRVFIKSGSFSVNSCETEKYRCLSLKLCLCLYMCVCVCVCVCVYAWLAKKWTERAKIINTYAVRKETQITNFAIILWNRARLRIINMNSQFDLGATQNRKTHWPFENTALIIHT